MDVYDLPSGNSNSDYLYSVDSDVTTISTKTSSLITFDSEGGHFVQDDFGDNILTVSGLTVSL